MNNSLKTTYLSIVVVSFLLILSDILFYYTSDTFKLSSDIKALALIIPLGLGFVLNPYRKITVFFISLIAMLQIMQFSHISYFGTHISPYGVKLMIQEFSDVMLETANVFKSKWYVILIAILPFYAMYIFLKKVRTKKSIIGTILLFSVFVSTGIRLYRSETPRFMPNEVRFTIDNSIKTFLGYIIINIKNYDIKQYKKYEITDLKTELPEEINIVYIIGESVNYNHMSLFGYARKTTPKLEDLSKNTNFYYTKGIAGSISTLSSLKFITNVVGEPDNVVLTSSDETNLFKLAKNKGFKTFYLSNQTEHLISAIGGIKYIDKLITKDSSNLKNNSLMDEYLFKLINEQNFGKRNFIVLHQRCIHSPFATTFGKDYKNRNVFIGSKDKIVDEYDNAVLYDDYLISEMFNMFNKKRGKFYIIWASDHNELMGEGGLFGHGHGYLVPQTADIPVFVQTNDENFLKRMKNTFRPTHYEIAKNIAFLFGYDIKNPNEEQGVFYITGIDYAGKCGFIKFLKDLKNSAVKYFDSTKKQFYILGSNYEKVYQ